MAWNADPALKTNGVSSITKTQCDAQIVENLKALSRRLSTRATSVAATSVANNTGTTVDFASGTSEWGDVLSPPFDKLDLQARDPGLWYHGVTGYFEANGTGDRRISAERAVGGSDTSRRRTLASAARKTRLSMASVEEFSAPGDGVTVEAFQTSGGALDVTADMWGLWMGVNDASSGTTALAHTMLDENVGATAWWNNWRSNAFRLYRRPSCRLRKTSVQSLADGVFTAVTFGTAEYDTASMNSAHDIEAQYDGFYYATTCLALSAYNGTADRFIVQFTVNGSGHGTGSTSHEVTIGDSYCTHEDVVYLSAGDLLGVRAFKADGGGGPVSMVINTEQTHLGATLVSGDIASSLVPNRQFFLDGLPDLATDVPALPFGDIDGVNLPRGLANFYTRDVWAHLWNPPVLSVQASTEGNTLSSGGWTKLDLDIGRYDNWGLLASNKSGGGLRLPMDGVWLAVAAVQLAGNDGSGSDGDRGLRIKHGADNLSPVRRDSATASNHYWGQAVSGLVNGSAGDVVTIEALSSAADEVDVTSALLHLVWQSQKE